MRRRKRPWAFTLVEVMVTSTISVMLITTILGLTMRLEADRRRAEKRMTHRHDVESLRSILRRDLSGCESIQIGSNEFRLVGPLSTEPVTGSNTLRPASVRYSVERHRQHGWLVRHEDSLLSDVRRDVLWIGVGTLRATAVGAVSQVGQPVMSSSVRILLTDSEGGVILGTTVAVVPGGLP